MLQIKKTRSNFCAAMCMDCCIHFYVYNLYVFYAPVLVDEKLEDLGLHYENRMIVDKISYKIKDPERLDIIVFHVTEDKSYIKHIIGLPGDMIEYWDDVLYINGKAWKESALDAYYEQLPENELFVLGDNHHYSDDSRDPLIGIISMDMVVGKTSFV